MSTPGGPPGRAAARSARPCPPPATNPRPTLNAALCNRCLDVALRFLMGAAFRTSNADAGAAVAAPAASSTDAAKMERTSLSPSSSPPWPPPPPPPQSFAPISRLGSCGGNAGGERRSALLSGVEEHDAAASAATAAPSPSALSDGVRLRGRSGNVAWTPLASGWCESALLKCYNTLWIFRTGARRWI